MIRKLCSMSSFGLINYRTPRQSIAKSTKKAAKAQVKVARR